MKATLVRSPRVLPILLVITPLAVAACSDDESEVVSPSPGASKSGLKYEDADNDGVNDADPDDPALSG